MDKEDVVYMHNGILLNSEKEQNCIIYRDVDGPRGCHPERNVRKKKYIYHINILNAYMCNLSF